MARTLERPRVSFDAGDRLRFGSLVLSRRALLAPMLAGSAGLLLGAKAMPALRGSEEAGSAKDSLGAIAANRGILYGTAAASGQLKDAAFATVLAREARILVPEYELKRGTVERQQGVYDFSGADALLGFAQAHGMAFRGHTLVWHGSNPTWLEDALHSPRKEAVLTGYVEALAAHYRGTMHSWDVVNEALHPADRRADFLRDSVWLKAFGPSYIDMAFHAAHAADPHALLVYNDWGCEADGPEHDRFRAATLTFLEQAKARGVPIDAYGMQGHLQAFGPKVDQGKLRDFLAALHAMGLRILITEHDVDDSGGPLDVGTRDQAVADVSRRFLDVVLDNPAAIAVLTWGLSDRFLDPPGWRAAMRGYSPRLLPLDTSFARKPMWHAMAQSFVGTRRI
jgi:endo-1,4-beta-xylanase